MNRRSPSLTSLVAFFLIATLYAASYFMMVSVERSTTTGIADATYPEFADPVAVAYRPMELIDKRLRADLWTRSRVVIRTGPSRSMTRGPVTVSGVVYASRREALIEYLRKHRE